MDDLVTLARHNRQSKEFVIFDREELSFLVREQHINEEMLRNFGSIIGVISKEYVMIPADMF